MQVWANVVENINQDFVINIYQTLNMEKFKNVKEYGTPMTLHSVNQVSMTDYRGDYSEKQPKLLT